MSLRKMLEQLTDEKLKVIMQEQIDWEKVGYLTDDTQIRAIAIQHFHDDAILLCDRVACEAFRVYALRVTGMR